MFDVVIGCAGEVIFGGLMVTRTRITCDRLQIVNYTQLASSGFFGGLFLFPLPNFLLHLKHVLQFLRLQILKVGATALLFAF